MTDDAMDAGRLDDQVALRPGPVAPDTPEEARFIEAITTGDSVARVVSRLSLEPLATRARIRRLIDRGVLMTVPSRAPGPPPAGRAVAAAVALVLLGATAILADPFGASRVPVTEPLVTAEPITEPAVPAAEPALPELAAPDREVTPPDRPAVPVAKPVVPPPVRASAPSAKREPVAPAGFDAGEIRAAPELRGSRAEDHVYVGAAGDRPLTLRLDPPGTGSGVLVYDAPEGRRELAVMGRIDDAGVDVASDGVRVHATLSGERLLGRCWLSDGEAPRQCLLVRRE